jgi:thymidylate synthase (FAD)
MHGTIRSWIHYCDVRTDPSTQKEHRLIAIACREILYDVFPSLKPPEC